MEIRAISYSDLLRREVNHYDLRDNIKSVHAIDLTADELSAKLLGLSQTETICVLDSCGVGHLGSHLMIAGISPVEILEISNENPNETLDFLEEKLSGKLAGVFTMSYEFGLKLQNITLRAKEFAGPAEPDVFLALYDGIIVHDYTSGETGFIGESKRFGEIAKKLKNAKPLDEVLNCREDAHVVSNFTQAEYLVAVETVKEHIRAGDTYQANITQQLSVELSPAVTSQAIFSQLRKDHPAPFSAFIKRNDSVVVSASPERFVKIDGHNRISASPIKGTRPRGLTLAEDVALREELLTSEKDRAENTMIVDLMRNDLGRVCEYGSVKVEKLCNIEEHPTLFHLVSTVTGELRDDVGIDDIIRAVFPCGSITGAPKIRTMQIIDEIETAARGLSMGAIGCYIPESKFQIPSSSLQTRNYILDLSVAIRTMVIRDEKAVFNVGGGIVIDSDPEKEYEESLLKARALLAALEAKISSRAVASHLFNDEI